MEFLKICGCQDRRGIRMVHLVVPRFATAAGIAAQFSGLML